LKEIKGLNKFITTNVTNMCALFQQCHQIEYIDLSNFNTINVTDMSGMFNKCFKLKQIKGLNKFITTKATNMFIMFQACNELEYLDLSNFDTSNVKSMENTFNQCHK